MNKAKEGPNESREIHVTKPASTDRPTIRVKPHSYQPSKAELETPIRTSATPEQLARAAVTPVRIIENPNA